MCYYISTIFMFSMGDSRFETVCLVCTSQGITPLKENKRGTIMKVGANKEHRKFVQIIQSTVRNKELSFKAKGLLAFLLSYPSDWDFSLNYIVEESGEKITTVRSALKELEDKGYFQRVRHTNSSDKVIKWEYIIYESNNPDDWVI